MTLTFIRSIPREGDARTFIFQPPADVNWQPGQYIYYILPHPEADDRGIKRWFTISAAPSEKEVRITTRINAEHSSSFKTALLALKPGDTIEAEAPEGDFTVEDPTRNYIFIAGGIGITPFRSILVEAAARGQQLHVTLLYANRNEDIVFKQELEKLREQNPHLEIDYIIQPRRLDAALLEQQIKATDAPLVYISGPEPMVESLTDQVAALGVDKDDIKSDYFPGYEAE